MMTKAELEQYNFLEKEIRMHNGRLKELDKQRKRILKNIRKCERLQEKVKKFIDSIEDSYTRQIFYYRFIENKTWASVAMKVSNGNSTADATRKYVERYLERSETDKGA